MSTRTCRWSPTGQVLADLIDHWGLDRPALVGHDIGGAVTLRAHLLEGVAASHLGLIDAVVLAPWITPRTREMQQNAERYASLPDPQLEQSIIEHLRTATVTTLPDEIFEELFGQWKGAEGQALYVRNFMHFNEEHTWELEPMLPTITAPTAVVWGQQDAWLPVEVSERIAGQIPSAVLPIIADGGHFSMEDDPAAVCEALEELLDRR